MTSTLQNRLVGTIIVVALVVILLPEFLDGEKRTNKQEFVDIPPALEIVEVETPNELDLSDVKQKVSQPVEVINDFALDDTQAAAQNSPKQNETNNKKSNSNAENTEAQITSISDEGAIAQNTNGNNAAEQNIKEKPTSDVNKPDPLDEITIKDSGWVVQLGSFRHEKNVKILLKTLNDAGYRAYSTPVMTSVGQLNKVFVGPELNKNKLEQALPHLQEITQLKGKITAFEVSAR